MNEKAPKFGTVEEELKNAQRTAYVFESTRRLEHVYEEAYRVAREKCDKAKVEWEARVESRREADMSHSSALQRLSQVIQDAARKEQTLRNGQITGYEQP